MTGTDNGREAYAAERAELARLLPPAPGTDLPPGRHEHHRERLMNLIDDDTARARGRTGADAQDRARERAGRPDRSRLLRPSFLAPATALAVAGALVLGYAAQNGGGPADTGDTRSVSQVLLRMSDAAGRSDALPIRDDQFLYTRGTGRDVDLTSGKAVIGPLEESESWYSQKPGPQKKLGLIRQGGHTSPINAELGDSEGTRPGLNRPTYRWLATLPTDPRQLLDYFDEITPKFEGRTATRPSSSRSGVWSVTRSSRPTPPPGSSRPSPSSPASPGLPTRWTPWAARAWGSPATTSVPACAPSGSSTRRTCPTWAGAAI
ncbi:CU044_5270 family protein [Streptomyces sp. SM1P]